MKWCMQMKFNLHAWWVLRTLHILIHMCTGSRKKLQNVLFCLLYGQFFFSVATKGDRVLIYPKIQIIQQFILHIIIHTTKLIGMPSLFLQLYLFSISCQPKQVIRRCSCVTNRFLSPRNRHKTNLR